MVVSRIAHGCKNRAIKGGLSDPSGMLPTCRGRGPIQGAIACESKLTPSASGVALIDDATNTVWIIPMADAIQNDLRYGALAGFSFPASFVIDSLSKTFECPSEFDASCRESPEGL
ncbi:hypothetical protein GCM10023208_21430 [Erythrobacter westpacificensis]|uniref:Uncharacterized protein n=1 Tax=Erythrobacter westpacificensis TaxID=1055231 RepID=A0ABP9KHC1_9SPHN